MDKNNKKLENQDLSKLKTILKSPVTKTIGICTLMGISLGGGFIVGREVGIEQPATYKYYSNNKRLATVNGEELSYNDFKASMKIMFHINKDKRMTKEEISEYEQDLIEYNALTTALYNAAKDSKIEVDEDAIKETYDSTMNQVSQMLGIEVSEVLKKFNLTEEGIKNTLTKEYIANKYLEKESTVLEDEAEKYYNENKEEFYEYKASHILFRTTDDEGVSVDDKKKSELKKQAEEILKRIKNGESFEKLATEYSHDGSAENGGDLGYFGSGYMVNEFEEAVKKTEIGQLYPEIVETEYGYHIIKRTGERYQTFDDNKDTIRNELSYTKKTEILEKVREEANIEIFYK